jgi:hypothetical protein
VVEAEGDARFDRTVIGGRRRDHDRADRHVRTPRTVGLGDVQQRRLDQIVVMGEAVADVRAERGEDVADDLPGARAGR